MAKLASCSHLAIWGVGRPFAWGVLMLRNLNKIA
jgi:hypothetical protein